MADTKKKSESLKATERYMYLGPRISSKDILLVPNTIYKGIPDIAKKDDDLKKLFVKIDSDFGKNRKKFKEDKENRKIIEKVIKKYMK